MIFDFCKKKAILLIPVYFALLITMLILNNNKLNCISIFIFGTLLFSLIHFLLCRFYLTNKKHNTNYEIFFIFSNILIINNFIQGLIEKNPNYFIIDFVIIPAVISSIAFAKIYKIEGGIGKKDNDNKVL